jgi:hypothetical protein
MSLINEIQPFIEKAWSEKTTFSPDDYQGKDPAYGQCIVTSCLIRMLYGGIIMKGRVGGRAHVWNYINGYSWDFTSSQFPKEFVYQLDSETNEQDLIDEDWKRERFVNFLSLFFLHRLNSKI